MTNEANTLGAKMMLLFTKTDSLNLFKLKSSKRKFSAYENVKPAIE